MKRLFCILSVTLTVLTVGIFYYSYGKKNLQTLKRLQRSSITMNESVSKDVMVINHLRVPRFDLNHQYSCSVNVEESYLSPESSLITCKHVQGSIVNGECEVGTFIAPQMNIYRDEKILESSGPVHVTFSGFTGSGEDVCFAITKKLCTIKKNIQIRHALGILSAGSVEIDTSEQVVIFDGGIESNLFLSGLHKS